jgi:hypothetical protein
MSVGNAVTPANPTAAVPADSTSEGSRDSDVAAPGSKAAIWPAGTKWVASLSQKMYYPATCPAVRELPEEDRLYYATEDGPRRGEFRKSIVCN